MHIQTQNDHEPLDRVDTTAKSLGKVSSEGFVWKVP
jgi:hypothetical protein